MLMWSVVGGIVGSAIFPMVAKVSIGWRAMYLGYTPTLTFWTAFAMIDRGLEHRSGEPHRGDPLYRWALRLPCRGQAHGQVGPKAHLCPFLRHQRTSDFRRLPAVSALRSALWASFP